MLFKELNNKLTLTLEFLAAELTKIRTGKAAGVLVEDIEVDVYGSKMKIKELASISTPDPQTIIVSPWDKSIIKDVAKALQESSLGLNPIVGADSIKLVVPPLTEERRKELIKVVNEKLEECKNSMRNIRQEAMKQIDKAFSQKEIGEDDKYNQRQEVEDIFKEFAERAEKVAEMKRQDILNL